MSRASRVWPVSWRLLARTYSRGNVHHVKRLSPRAEAVVTQSANDWKRSGPILRTAARLLSNCPSAM